LTLKVDFIPFVELTGVRCAGEGRPQFFRQRDISEARPAGQQEGLGQHPPRQNRHHDGERRFDEKHIIKAPNFPPHKRFPRIF
jgi:hypothetical protein